MMDLCYFIVSYCICLSHSWVALQKPRQTGNPQNCWGHIPGEGVWVPRTCPNVKSSERERLCVLGQSLQHSQANVVLVSEAVPTRDVSMSHSKCFTSAWGRLSGASTFTPGNYPLVPIVATFPQGDTLRLLF